MRPLSLMLLLGLVGPTLAAEPFTGPWNPTELQKTPKVEWVDTTGPLRKLYYSGEPYLGKPTRVFAYAAFPDGPATTKRPAMVLVHGGGGTAFPEWATLWAKRGYVAIAMDLAGVGPDRQRLPDGGPPQDDESKFGKEPRELHDMWTYHAIADVMLAVSLLQSLPEVDPDRIGITGISWGGYLTCIAAGVDQRLKVAVPVYGCGHLHDNSVWLSRFSAMTPEWKKSWIAQFDPSSYVGQATMPMLFVNGTNDFAYPLDSYQQTYDKVKNRTLCITVNMPHGHPQGWAPPEIGRFVDSVLTKGSPLVKLSEKPELTKDGTLLLKLPKENVKEVALHYTTDLKLPWQQRKWITVPVENGMVKRPTDQPAVVFFTVKDKNGSTTSSPHLTIK